MEIEERDFIINKVNNRFKQIIIDLAVQDELPMDLTLLDASVFSPCSVPLVDALITLQEDAEWALDDRWDRTDAGFEAQISLIDKVL